MYEADDPRSALTAMSGTRGAVSAFGDATYARFYETPPQDEGEGIRTWYARGQNFVVCYSEVQEGAVFERKGQTDEYVLLLHDEDMSAIVEVNGEMVEAPGYSITMIPPGDSRVTCRAAGRIVRLMTTGSEDLAAKASNAETYARPHPQIPPLQAWPKPAGGWRIRNYSLDVPEEEGRFGKIFRCTTFMVNIFPAQGPREVTKLSPHYHDDFEQCSLALEGYYWHHLRWPWTANRNDWRDDEHEKCASPSVCVIPPLVIHTSAASGDNNVLIDIFCPPREDFSDMEGWVLNAADYPRI